MTHVRTGALAAALGLALAVAVMGAHARAAWAGQPAAGEGDLAAPAQTSSPLQPTPPTKLDPQTFPGGLLTPPADPQPPQPPDGPGDLGNPTEHPDPPPPDGPGDLSNPTEHPDPPPPTATEPPSTPQPSGGAAPVPTPKRIDTGLGGTSSSHPGLISPTVMVLMAATALVVLVLASVSRRRTRSSR